MRLGDLDALREHWLENGKNKYFYDANSFLESIDEQPTVDPVHAAGACYCWECVDNPGLKTETKGMVWCRHWRKETKPDAFCSYGKPKEENANG